LKSGGAIEMPPLEWGQHLIAHLFDVGPTMAVGMGEAPLSYVEIESWQRMVCVDLHPWEVQLLRRLSGEYLAESHKATKPDCPPPYGESPSLAKHRRKQMDRDLEAFLS
jgi:hypothetical protein